MDVLQYYEFLTFTRRAPPGVKPGGADTGGAEADV